MGMELLSVVNRHVSLDNDSTIIAALKTSGKCFHGSDQNGLWCYEYGTMWLRYAIMEMAQLKILKILPPEGDPT